MKISKILSSKNWVAINLPLAKQLGLNAAFLFSHLCGLFEYYEARSELVEKESEMYFYATIDTIAENTPLSRREQDTAISILEKAGLLKKKSIGTPSKRHFTIPQSAEETLYNILQFGVFSQTSKAENAKQECNKTPNKNVTKRQTSKAKNANNIDKELYLSNNSFSKEKDISKKTEVFFTPTENKKIIANANPKTGLFGNSETETEKEKSCAKKEKDETPKTGAKPSGTKFIKPNVDEVSAYCAENNLPVDAANFIDHYDANGWKVGSNSMKDWKAAVRNWARNYFRNPNNNLKPNKNNNQNETSQSTTKPNAKPDGSTFTRVLKRDEELNKLGY